MSRDLEVRLFGSTLEELRLALAYEPRLALLLECIETAYGERELDLSEASRRCAMSKNNLNSTLRRLSGHTCCELLTAYRVYRSIRLMQESNLSFTQVALECGFDNSSSYSRTVRRLLGASPAKLMPRGPDYRRKLQLPKFGKAIWQSGDPKDEKTGMESAAS